MAPSHTCFACVAGQRDWPFVKQICREGENAENVVLIGGPGPGKSHVATALGAGDRASSRQGALLLHHRIGQQEKALEKTGKPLGALLNLPTHRCHILETGNDSYHFKASSDAATKTAKEKPALTKT